MQPYKFHEEIKRTFLPAHEPVIGVSILPLSNIVSYCLI